MEVSDAGGTNGAAVPPASPSLLGLAPTIDPQLVVDHLADLLSVTLGASPADLQSHGSLLAPTQRHDTITRCQRFASEAQTVLYVRKDLATALEINGHNDNDRGAYTYSIASEISFQPTTIASVALIKRPQPIDPKLPISSQIQVVNLPGSAIVPGADQTLSSPFETLHALVQLALAPYFDAYTKSQEQNASTHGRRDADTRTGVPGAKKKIAELELSLRQLQQDTEIPELHLQLPDLIQDALQRAQAQNKPPTIDLLPRELLSDSQFLNEVQAVVKNWIKSIQKITTLSRDPSTGTAAQEVNFWLAMETALEGIETQLRSDGVQLTMDVLKHAKRYLATTSLVTDTKLRDASDKVLKYNQLMRDFPLEDLLAAISLERVQYGVIAIFTHLIKKLKLSPYPISRALALLSAISADLEHQVAALLNGRTLMYLEYPEFLAVMDAAERVWKSWDDNVREFTTVARDLVRKRNEMFIPMKILTRHTKIQERLAYVRNFRVNHEQLQRTIANVLGPRMLQRSVNGDFHGSPHIADAIGDTDAADEVAEAYAVLKDVDVLDTSAEGTAIWIQAEAMYNERTVRVENSIIARLRDRIALARTADEMFRVFSQFNALFVRPKIRGAISEYQTQLIDSVKRDITALHERFKLQYGHSEAHVMAQVRDIPSVSGSIIWARQIERQLDNYLHKVEDVLGADWTLHTEGEKLAAEGANFRKKLDTTPVFESWLADVNDRRLSVSGRIFGVTRNRALGNVLELTIVFDPQIVALFKEVRNLLWLNFQIPHAIHNMAREAKRVYPYAVSLMENARILAQTSRVIDAMPDVSMLLASYQKTIQGLVQQGMQLKWESLVHRYDVPSASKAIAAAASAGRSDSKHIQFIRSFGTAVSVLQSKTETLRTVRAKVLSAVAELKTCPYEEASFLQSLANIQTAVDQLNLEDFTNLTFWVAKVNDQIEAILLERLRAALQIWIQTFKDLDASRNRREMKSIGPAADANLKTRSPEDPTTRSDSSLLPRLQTALHELSIQDQLISLDPPSEHARAEWIFALHAWLAIICNLPLLQASRYAIQSTAAESDSPSSRFHHLPQKCLEDVQAAYQIIGSRVSELNTYLDQWLQFQSLWDLQSDQIIDMLGDDLGKWLQLLQEIRKTRATFDTSESSRSFGNLIIDFEQVQTKVNAKYDQWQHDILHKFASRLGQRMQEVFADLQKTRQDLEAQSLDASSTAQAVSLITIVQQSRRRVEAWELEVEIFRKGQTTLVRQRFPFPQDWLHIDQLDQEWVILQEILARKLKVVEDQTDALRAKILAEDQLIKERIRDINASWAEEKPVSGTIAPDDASATLSSFSARVNKLRQEYDLVEKAKEAMDLPSSTADLLTPIIEEVQDFSSVWSALSTIWISLDELRDMLWTTIQPRKLRQSLDNLLKVTKDMPSRMRQYAAFEHVQNVLRQLLKANSLLADLKSEAVRERHWAKIYKTLKPNQRFSPSSMTLGNVWDLQLVASEAIIRDIVVQAQGEMALEEFLKQVRETWSSYSLDLVNYHNKCRLIRGWDDLFAKCSEHLNSLQAMQHSPYYKVFEEDATAWEDKLNRVHILFDVWIDVQRQWVYLEGVFTGNADIKHLLPTESARFASINTEFLTLLKKVAKSPYVLDVLNLAGIQKSLEHLADLLGKIQKALGEYLERERMSFPRFCFVGDEDLLEMIGNSNDTLRIAKHLRKMFAGLAGLQMDDEQTISGFTSKEGEEIRLSQPISLTKIPKINDWLTALEHAMKVTLSNSLCEAVQAFEPFLTSKDLGNNALEEYLTAFPAQIAILGAQCAWTAGVEQALHSQGQGLQALYDLEVGLLEELASIVLRELDSLTRKKCEHLITEFVHQRDVLRKLIDHKANTPSHFQWLLQMRYNFDSTAEPLKRLHVRMANADLPYGFEYLGVPDRLVRTPLTDRCFSTLTQALAQRLGGSPYGPAGTGKTESVKALGLQLGRFTLVFNCDDTFDFQAMGRIFLGICQVGAWGCFDEFNRLEERILSAVSQQVQNIQIGLRKSATDSSTLTELAGRQFKVHPNAGIFITMNPGYAGRSNLPDNLKKLFRSVAMSKPDKELIAEVMLFSQGFKQAKTLSAQTVPFFEQCASRLSKQAHYDFGLRALKSVLVSSGALKRARLGSQGEDGPQGTDGGNNESLEPQIIVQSIRETIAPKLVRQDAQLLQEIQAAAFPGVQYVPAHLEKLEAAIRNEAARDHLIVSNTWLMKALQLYQIQAIHHGVMMVGQSGTGKSAIWKVLLRALQEVEGIEGVHHIIDSKVMSKEALYGNLDSTTREWTDGLFTGILRKIVDNLRGEDSKRHWIVFDGDVDPEWVENLNSVLDDNKILTLPNGERLSLPPNVRILFEVETLKYATLATVSRCGMVWFNEDTVTAAMMFERYLARLRTKPLEDLEDEGTTTNLGAAQTLAVQSQAADVIGQQMLGNGLLDRALDEVAKLAHIMEFTPVRAVTSLCSLLNKACRMMLEYNLQHEDFPLELQQIERFALHKMLLAVVWAFSGDCRLADRRSFGNHILNGTTIEGPVMTDDASIIDFDVTLPQGDWTAWQSQVPSVEINTHSVTQTDVVIPTLDTVRHEDVLYSWLAEHRPLILCGPPGSGKTMTLFSALRKLPNMEVAGLNFSSATTPDLILKTFDQYCEFRKTLNGVVMSPRQLGRWLVIFCDEINLPAADKYGTQRAVAFLRQLVEHNGFWRTADKTWVTLERIQFVGACNPPTDVGRTPLGLRFLRHAPLVMVDYPGEQSLKQIYGTFNNAVLKVVPNLRGHAPALTAAMVQFYLESQQRFTPQMQPHYVYSPRELTRWVRGIYEAIRPLENIDLEGLVRIWAHEALRLFSDRLVADEERKWTDDAVRRVALTHFPMIDEERALKGPILFSHWGHKHYVSMDRERIRDEVKARLKTFCEEEVDIPLIPFDDVLEHVLRIDRVFQQPQGHLILIGVSGSGKTTLSRFVAWMSNLKVFQIKVHGRYSASDFDDDLREVLRRAGCKNERICFIMDESNVLDSGFLERMNTLLANAEIPGLFEGDEYAALMTACREGAQRDGLLLDSQEELYKWFTQQIVKNLHIVFTMNPPEDGLSSKAATSPALFNRCVLNWFGDWSDQALFQVGSELTHPIDLDAPSFDAPANMPLAYKDLPLPARHRDAVVNAMVFVHHSLADINARLYKQQGRRTYVTPRHYLDFVSHFVRLFGEKREDLEEQQRHLNVGLDKLLHTVDKVRDMRATLAQKKTQLETKDAQANEKLQRMITDQREAEKRKAMSLQIQANLEKQEAEVAKRMQIVNADLEQAEPAVLEAKESVSNIKKQHLTEVRSMGNPPAGVKLALEAVCTLLGHKPDSWKAIQAIVRRDDFIASIVRYDNEEQMTRPLRLKMLNDYLSNDDFTFERVNRASKACGPLVQWVTAQVHFSDILDRVGPLRQEAQKLEDAALQTRAEAQAIENAIRGLENSIAQYKSEYAALISETQSIKAEMERVEFRVNRSVKLLDSLSSERERWETTRQSFEAQTSTLVGDTLVAAAFLAYSGLYDQQYRKSMMESWLEQLSLSGIEHKAFNTINEFLSTADERVKWRSHGLPADDLCTENAIILQRFNRYPLIIDPSGRASEFLQRENGDRKLTVTSFLDASFVKQLESSLRFGNPILIQDAEHLDPILNHVLNKEYQKTGGRVLIELGKQEIDFSPAFKLYLSTRDPSVSFPPDICSRTTFVNFTITRSSLQTQSLNDVLKSERPDVDERRSNLLKMQGQFHVHLRGLEKQLLQALNNSQGNILEDDVVVETLERLKHEAAEIARKMRETEGVMAEVEAVTDEYSTIARACSSVFSVLEQLHHLNHFYQFSLQYFMDIFNSVLHDNPHLAGVNGHAERAKIILQDLFVTTYQRTALSLLQTDRMTLAMLLAQATPYEMDRGLIDVLVDARLHGQDIPSDAEARKDALKRLKLRQPLHDQICRLEPADWSKMRNEEAAERHVPSSIWPDNASPLTQQLYVMLFIKLFRSDRLVPAAELFVTSVFGPNVLQAPSDLQRVVQQVSSATPIALCSSPGFDASYKVDQLVERQHASCVSLAMGSAEGVTSADSAISNAAARGTWVLVKNVHLAPSWLQSLEKRLATMKPHVDFRLFLSMETNPKIPINLLRLSRVLMYEQPAGIRANMRDSLSSLSSRAADAPVEKARLYFLLSFVHAVAQERLRYAPTLGWKGLWEFNDADYECAAFIIDAWMARVAQGRSNIAPTKIPWELLRTLIAETYGGKIDNEGDFDVMQALIAQALQAAAYDDDFELVRASDTEDGHGLTVPSGTGLSAFLSWVDRALPEREPPTYLGLPANAEKLLLVGQGQRMVEQVAQIREVLEEEEYSMTKVEPGA